MTPVTIKGILECDYDKNHETYKINDRELAQITFLGRIEKLQEASTFFTYTVEDGTGRVDVKVGRTREVDREKTGGNE